MIYISNQQTRLDIYILAPVMCITRKSRLYSQALRLNRIFSKNSWYDKRCNELEVWLKDKGYSGYSDNLVRRKILKASTHKRNDLLKNMKDQQLVLSIPYHPKFSNLNNTMSFLYLLLTQDQERQKVFNKAPIISFLRAKNLKNILVKAKVPPLQKNEGFCRLCKKSRCGIWKQMVNTNSFKSTTTQWTYPVDQKV